METFIAAVNVNTPFFHLHNYDYVKLVGLVKIEFDKITPVGIRLVLDSELIRAAQISHNLCSADFLVFESALALVLQETKYVVENNKAHYFEYPIYDGLYWSFDKMCFTTERGPEMPLNLRPTTLVSSVTDHWKEILLMQSTTSRKQKSPIFSSNGRQILSNSILIVSHDIDSWASVCQKQSYMYNVITDKGLSVNNLRRGDIILCDPTMIDLNYGHYLNLCKIVNESMVYVAHGKRTDDQIQRILVENLCKKFPEMIVPIHLFAVQTVILDDLDINLPESLSSKWHQIFKENITKPQGLSEIQMKRCFPNLNLGLMAPIIDNFVPIIATPKSILKKFRIFSHLVKTSQVEDRVAKIFSNRYSPLNQTQTLKRFAGKALSYETAQTLVREHFSRLTTSIGTFLNNSDEFYINEPYVLSSLENEKNCVVCMESLDTTYSFTICGHIFCKDCSKLFFQPNWILNLSKDCAACRTPLLIGDVFFIEKDAKEIAFVSSKQASVENFYKGVRNLNCVDHWNSKCSEDKFIKHVVVDNLSSCSPSDLIKQYVDKPNSINVHVFYTAEEVSLNHQFVTSF